MTKRAYGKEGKQMRQEEILAAARRLFASSSGELLAVAEITVAGLAKGTVYLYFATKEAIFAALILEGWRGVLDEVDEVFAATALVRTRW